MEPLEGPEIHLPVPGSRQKATALLMSSLPMPVPLNSSETMKYRRCAPLVSALMPSMVIWPSTRPLLDAVQNPSRKDHNRFRNSERSVAAMASRSDQIPVVVIIPAVELCDPSDRPGDIALGYGYIRHISSSESHERVTYRPSGLMQKTSPAWL